ncbi:SIR2 family protein [Actinosynnema sp. NPDC051121]
MSPNRRLPAELVDQFALGNGVVFVGEEAARQSGLPGRDATLRELADAFDEVPARATGEDLAWYYEIEHGRGPLVGRVRDRLDADRAEPGSIHRAVVAANASVIVSTTHDDLVERALRDARTRFATIVRGPQAEVRLTDRLPVVKLFGDFSQPADMVLTSRDRERFRYDRSPVNQLVELMLRTRTALFVGYRADDPELRMVLNEAYGEQGRSWNNVYCVVAENAPLPIRDLERRGMGVIHVADRDGYDHEAVADWLTELGDVVRSRRQPAVEVGGRPDPDTRSQLFAQVSGLLQTMGHTLSQVRRDRSGGEFVAEMRSAGIRRRFRCVESSLNSADVRAMAALVEREEGTEGWLVTYRRGVITAQAHAEAAKHPAVRVMSVAEFHLAVLNLDAYLRRLIENYESSEVSRYWVDLACEVPLHDRRESAHLRTDSFDSVEEFLDTWIDTPGRNHISVLGDFGMGKTWLCHHYAATLAKRYLRDPEHSRVPFVISLRNAQRSSNLREMIMNVLVDEFDLDLPGGYRTFEFLNHHDSMVLIFDGFDEMQVQVDARKVEENFEELARVVVPEANSKVILTCRTGYFRTDIEGRGLLAGEGIRRIRLRERPNFEILSLRRLDEQRIRDILRLRVPGDWERHLDLIARTYDLPDLAHRPIMLSMITTTLPRLVDQEHITPAGLYQAYTDEWIQKNVDENRTFVDTERKSYFMQELAWEMWQRETLSIHYTEFPQRVRDHFDLDDDTVDYFEHDVRTQTFLQRDNRGYYMFAHKSFMEFFIAQKIHQRIRAGDSTLLAQAQTSHETDQFIKDFLIQEPEHVPTLVEWMRSGEDELLRVNAAGVLAKVGDPATTDQVIAALEVDDATRDLYLTAVLFRVLEIQWDAASRLAARGDATFAGVARLPADQLPKVVERFCAELHNHRDGVARWFSAGLLARVRDVAPTLVDVAFREALTAERTTATLTLLRRVLARS